MTHDALNFVYSQYMSDNSTAAFMPPSLFFEVVLPLLEVDRTSMLAISTPSDEGNMNFCK